MALFTPAEVDALSKNWNNTLDAAMDDEEYSVLVEGMLPHKTLAKEREDTAETFFNLMLGKCS
jgi:hypothetical protein